MSSDLSMNGADVRAVLRVVHDVDVDGRVLRIDVEAIVPVTHKMIALAAWNAARRRHPWIVGDDAADKLEEAKQIALKQLNELLSSADEVLLVIQQAQPAGAENETEEFRDGYIAATEDLRGSPEIERLRDAAIDLRGYVPALHGNLPTGATQQIGQRFNRAG